MQTLPTTRDIRHARRRTEATVKQLSMPLMAALGAVDTATRAVNERLARMRAEAGEHAQDNRDRLQQALTDLQNRVSGLPADVRDLRHRLEPAELRRLTDEYADAAQRAYNDLVRRGQDVFGDFHRRPQVSRAVGAAGSGVDAAQQRLEAVVTDLNNLADDLSARFARGSRSAGERAARTTEQASGKLAEEVRATGDEVAEVVTEAGEDAAASTRSATRKAANRASAPSRPANRGTSTKSGSGNAGTRQS